ncbi:YceD family protein [Chamaesiphon sp. VAR_48_metabat_135_sub]|uniref:YceD family protein n=1 Tax=Chamaesiphon sp. VAR_48_metabat_135_sub TaxID=2964699 RepID=UPI00286B6D0D|nr:YceD family protein [Chamaesiphon sp. VAR_48_metabat_135_sub]
MEPLHIPQLANRQDRTLEIIVDTLIPEFETLTPVRGKVIVKHGGTFLDLSAQAETIITLKCDRCLQQYNHRLLLDATEIIWLEEVDEEPDRRGMEIRTDLDELVDSLPPDGHFDPNVWLYEQLCLSLPLRQLCDRDCAGIIPPIEPDPELSEAQQLLDSRWGILGTLKNRLEE